MPSSPSIWITASSLTGSGAIQTNASPKGVVSTNRGSGGGRVAVYYNDATGFSDLSNWIPLASSPATNNGIQIDNVPGFDIDWNERGANKGKIDIGPYER